MHILKCGDLPLNCQRFYGGMQAVRVYVLTRNVNSSALQRAFVSVSSIPVLARTNVRTHIRTTIALTCFSAVSVVHWTPKPPFGDLAVVQNDMCGVHCWCCCWLLLQVCKMTVHWTWSQRTFEERITTTYLRTVINAAFMEEKTEEEWSISVRREITLGPG